MVAFLGVTVARAVAAPLNPNYTKVGQKEAENPMKLLIIYMTQLKTFIM